MDIEANRLTCRRLNKRHVLAILFVELEVISLVLDLLGKSELVFVLAAFLLSALGFGMTVYTCINKRTIALTRSQGERQLGVVEIAFSAVLLVATLAHFVFVSAGVKENYSSVSLFPVVFSIVVVIFIFRKDRVLLLIFWLQWMILQSLLLLIFCQQPAASSQQLLADLSLSASVPLTQPLSLCQSGNIPSF